MIMVARCRSRAVKRAMDVTLSAVALAGLSPVLGIVGVLVRLRLGSPVLFRQTRAGLRGRQFTLFKFRSMSDRRDATGALLPDGERLTSLGRFLRSTSLDELPTLANVLSGSMSIVGPRPLLPRYLPLYSASQSRRHEVRPGITGLAQVSGRNSLSWAERLDLDARYVDNWSLWLDLMIIARTFRRVLTRQDVTPPGMDTMPLFRGTAPDDRE